jgi:hypothetical protein
MPMQNEKRHERRRTILIDREFQLRFIGRLGGVLFFYLLLFIVISIVAPVAFTFLGDPPEWAVMETAFRVEVLLRLILAPLICTFLCLFFHGVLETFRVAGPNYRFKAVFRGLQQLQLPRGVQIRKGDFLQDTAREFDEALVALHDHVVGLQKEAHSAAEKTRAALRDPADADARAALAAIESVERELAAFSMCTRAPACRPIVDSNEPVEPLAEAQATAPATASESSEQSS